MAIEILLPKLGLTMEEGTIEEWLVDDGSVITVGMPLLRLATDKIDVDVEAEAEGILAKAVPDGATLNTGSDPIGCSLKVRRPRVALTPHPQP